MRGFTGWKPPPEPDGARTMYWSNFEHHATALGYYCINFSFLEYVLDRWIEILLGCTGDQRRVIVNATGQISNRCTLLRGLLYTSPMPENSNWREEAENYLNHLTSVVIPLRNRLIHDSWLPSSPPQQIEEHARLGKAQSFQPKALLNVDLHDRELADVWDAASHVSNLSGCFHAFYAAYQDWKQTGQIEDIPRLQALSSMRQRDPRPSGREGTPPPPESSQG